MKQYDVGYTTGVFDMFHIGHLNVLRNAKQYCNKLIVGVSTDEVVVEYKHKKPIIPLEERIEIVRAIKYVDDVVVQETMDKFEAWKRIGFDVMFHGDDWKNSPMFNKYQEQFSAVNVDIVFLPHTDSTSSTILAEKLINS